MGSFGPRRIDPEYPAAVLGNNILGQFGMMGRIGESVRENAGLAYYASTGLNAWIEGGSWEIAAGVDPDNLKRRSTSSRTKSSGSWTNRSARKSWKTASPP